MTPDPSTVLTRQQGRIGRITLNRPRTLNALTLEMIQTIAVALWTWQDDPAVHLAVIEASDGRAFCAGGDVRTVRDWVLAERFDQVEAFFVQEYALNRLIARYAKPVVALVDGICMGGGLGLAAHASACVATEHALFAMPEAQLGLFPDVGASYFLPRLRGSLGLYLGLTGKRVPGADACWAGLASHFVPRAKLAGLADALADDGLAALCDVAEAPQPSILPATADRVNAVFERSSLSAIGEGLRGLDEPWAAEALASMRAASPSALQWSFDLLRAGASRSLEECQRAETLLTRRACRHPDFAEGVRANVVDKDRRPQWQPLGEVAASAA